MEKKTKSSVLTNPKVEVALKTSRHYFQHQTLMEEVVYGTDNARIKTIFSIRLLQQENDKEVYKYVLSSLKYYQKGHLSFLKSRVLSATFKMCERIKL